MTEQSQQQSSGGAGGGETSWYPEPMKEFVTGKGWKSPAEALDSYVNLEKLVGAEKAGRTIVLPKDEKDIEGTKVFRAKMGVPENAADYKLPVPEGQDPKLAEWASGVFHRLGTPAAQARTFVEEWNKHIDGIVTATQAEESRVQTEQMNGLKTEWGDKFAGNAELAKRALTQFGSVAKLDKANLDSLLAAVEKSAPVMKLFAAVGSSVAEHGFAAGESGGTGFANSKKAIEAQIDELRQKRLANQVDEKTFHNEMQRLGPLLDAAA